MERVGLGWDELDWFGTGWVEIRWDGMGRPSLVWSGFGCNGRANPSCKSVRKSLRLLYMQYLVF